MFCYRLIIPRLYLVFHWTVNKTYMSGGFVCAQRGRLKKNKSIVRAVFSRFCMLVMSWVVVVFLLDYGTRSTVAVVCYTGKVVKLSSHCIVEVEKWARVYSFLWPKYVNGFWAQLPTQQTVSQTEFLSGISFTLHLPPEHVYRPPRPLPGTR